MPIDTPEADNEQEATAEEAAAAFADWQANRPRDDDDHQHVDRLELLIDAYDNGWLD